MTTWHSNSRNAPVFVRTPEPPASQDLRDSIQSIYAPPPSLPETPVLPATQNSQPYAVPDTPSIADFPSPPRKRRYPYIPLAALPPEKQAKRRELWRKAKLQRKLKLEAEKQNLKVVSLQKSLAQLVQMVRGNELMLQDLLQRISK